MIDFSKVPLTERQITISAALGVKLFHNWDTGDITINKRYWRAIRPEVQEAIARALTLPSIFDQVEEMI